MAEQPAVGVRDVESEPDSVVEVVEPWPSPVDGHELYNEVVALVRNHMVLPKGAGYSERTATTAFGCFRSCSFLRLSASAAKAGLWSCLRPLCAAHCWLRMRVRRLFLDQSSFGTRRCYSTKPIHG